MLLKVIACVICKHTNPTTVFAQGFIHGYIGWVLYPG